MQRHKFKPIVAERPVEKRPLSQKDVLARLEEYLRDEKMFTRTCVDGYLAHARYLISHYGIAAPSLEDARAIRADMIRQGRKPTTIRNRLNTLEHMAACQGAPFKVEKPRQTKRREVEHLTAVEARRLVEAAANVRDRAIVLTLLHGALRAREACNLELRDVDMSEGLIIVRDGKNHETSSVDMSDQLRAALKEWLLSRPLVEHQRVFMTVSGRPLQRHVLYRLVRRLGEDAGIARVVHPHLCRHTCASLMLDEGFTFREVSQHLRHRNPSSSLVYLHADRDVVRAKVKKFRY